MTILKNSRLRFHLRFGRSLFATASVLLLIGSVAPASALDTASPVHLSVAPGTGELTLQWPDGSKISGIYSRVELGDGSVFSTNDYKEHKLVHVPNSQSVLIRHTAEGRPTILQHVWLNSKDPWAEIQAEIVGSAAEKGTRHFSAVKIDHDSALFLSKHKDLQVLHIPYDNDMWFRFASVKVGKNAQETDSSEATAIYDNDSRRGFILGSLVHTQWKTSIVIRSQEDAVASLDIFGGLHGALGERSLTHDFVDHGLVKGPKILSPRVMVGEFSDWRNGLEEYGRRNAVFQPPLRWSGARPLGWNSWAAYANKINEQRYISAAQFVHDELIPHGFNRPNIYINFDAFWSNLDGVALVDAVRAVNALPSVGGAKVEPGIYWTPFAAWTDDLDSFVEGTNGKYRYKDILLKGPDGRPLPTVDGGKPIDPTHPAARMRTQFYIEALAKMGFKYLKIDFLSHGALEGAHYDPAVQTGTEAYNLGMQDLIKANAGRMFISLSIAPLFPSGYGHARRLSCDTKGHINGRDQSTEYMLNALTYGWWTDNSLYITDPDHVVLGEKADQGSRNFEEARSRLLSAVISGGMILDSSRLADDPEGRALAGKVYSIRPWMDLASKGKVFRPLDGGTGDQAAAVFYLPIPNGYYIAVFNYDDQRPHEISIPLDRVHPGFSGSSARLVDSGEELSLHQNHLNLKLAPSQSQLIKIVGSSAAIHSAPAL